MKIFCWRFLNFFVNWTNIHLLCKRAISFPGKVLIVNKKKAFDKFKELKVFNSIKLS